MDFEAFFVLAAGALMTQQLNEGTDSTNQSVRKPLQTYCNRSPKPLSPLYPNHSFF